MSEAGDVAKPPGDFLGKEASPSQNQESANKVQWNSAQLAKVLMTKRAEIVQELNVDAILVGLNTLLSIADRDILSAEQIRGEKCVTLIECMERQSEIGSYALFDTFLKMVAGTQPQLFNTLVGRSPTLAEADFCIEGFVTALKSDVQKKGHCTDSVLDEKIDLTKEHVQLKIRKISPECPTGIPVESGFSPHTYQGYLEKVLNEGKNGAVCENLNPDKEKRTVIQGRAGIGKTTTMQYFAQQWSVSKWASGFRVLFLLQLRYLMNTDVSMTAVELLTRYGLFQGLEGFDRTVLGTWMSNFANRVLILIDGLDEVSGFGARMKNSPIICNIDQKAHPVDLVINILRGNIMPKCSIISTSRPFIGLNELQNYSVQEILGLTKSEVRQYVQKKHPDRAGHIMSVLSRAPLLMSLCSITVYCMIISTLLAEGVELLDEDVQTYTRLTAFILVRYASRKLSDWPFVLEVNSFFSKLAHLAFNGIFQPTKGMSKLVFNEYDLAQAQLTSDDLNAMRKVGIIEFKPREIGKRKTVHAEFLHSTMQEMLSVAYCLCVPSDLDMEDMVRNVLSGGQFNMALLYLFGLHFDNNSTWIKDILVAAGHTRKRDAGRQLEKFLNALLQNAAVQPQIKLLICQLVHEGQVRDHAKIIHQSIAPNGTLSLVNTPMTVLDLKAVNFVCQFCHAFTEIQFSMVNADDTFIKILSSSLIKPHAETLCLLDLSNNTVGADGVRELAVALSENKVLHTLNLSNNNLGVDGGKAVSVLVKGKMNLQALDIAFCNIQEDGAKAVCSVINDNTKLKILNLRSNNLAVDGAAAVSAMLQSNKSLEVLAICGNGIGTKGVKHVMDSLHDHKGLHTLNVANNGIAVEGAKSVAKMLTDNSSIRILDISLNGIGEQGAKFLEKALYKLHSLILNGNGIGPAGVAAIGHALRERTSLRTLGISLNNIGSKGAKSVALMLKNNSTLQTLDMSLNNIGVQGAKDIAEALVLNQSLRALQLTGSDIGFEGQHVLAECSQRKPQFNLRFDSVATGQQAAGVNIGSLGVVISAQLQLTPI